MTFTLIFFFAAALFKILAFRLPLGMKDIDLVLQSALAANAPMPMASLLRDRFISAIAKGRAELDWSAIALGAADDAGLKESHPAAGEGG
jgi:3-hydroxyisobutyrate dehydrogenase-like beta-hydroxyacid dehydrogenase